MIEYKDDSVASKTSAESFWCSDDIGAERLIGGETRGFALYAFQREYVIANIEKAPLIVRSADFLRNHI